MPNDNETGHYENGVYTPGPPGPPGTYAYDVCDPNSPNYSAVGCKLRTTAAGHPSDWPGYKNQGGMGDDWWSGTGEIGSRNRYEDILESLRMRSIADPQQQATSFGADVLGGTGYYDLLQNLYGAAGADVGRGRGGVKKSTALAQLAKGNSPLLNLIMQTEGARDRTFAGAAGGALGPATSMVQAGYSGLQGYRGQDQQRYLREMEMEMQLKMLMAQIQAQAQQGGDEGLWDILSNLAQFVPLFF